MKKFILTGLICLFSFPWIRGQEYIPQITHRHYTSDSTLLQPRRPWKAALETFGLNMLVWSFDRYIVKEDWAYINGHTIKSNFKKGPVWDTDQFTTNLFSHPYHGSLYFNAARSNGMNFWQSAPFAAGGSLMWEARYWQAFCRRSAPSTVSFQEKPGDTVLQKDEPTLPFPSILSSRWDLVSSQNKKVRNGERPV